MCVCLLAIISIYLQQKKTTADREGDNVKIFCYNFTNKYVFEDDCRNDSTSGSKPARSFLLGSMAAVLFFFLGLTPYVYLILVGKFHPKPGSWGDLSSMKGMV